MRALSCWKSPPTSPTSTAIAPGQFLTFRVPHADGAFNRCYSLSSAPETDGRPR